MKFRTDQRAGATVTLRSLVKRYAREVAVSDVSLAVAPGEFVSLIGPSGSGKTTTLMMVAGFSQPDSGKIEINGIDVTHAPAQQRDLGMVFQNYAIFPHLNVYENVAFPLKVRGEAKTTIRERVEWALKTVKLEAMGHRFSRELSGGQQQRVALARAIVYHPRVILMDEPLGALDKNLRYHMQVELKELQQRLGMTVIYVTHDQEEAMNMSDRIVVMNGGRIEQAGSPVDVYETPGTSFVAKFLGEANLIPVDVESAGSRPTVRRRCDGFSLRWNSSGAPTPKSGYLFVRPEKVTIERGAGDGLGQLLRGTISRVSFLGNIVRYLVDAGDAQPLIVDMKNSDRQHHCLCGEAVNISWDPRDAQVIAL